MSQNSTTKSKNSQILKNTKLNKSEINKSNHPHKPEKPKSPKDSKMVVPELPPESKWKELPFKLEKPAKHISKSQDNKKMKLQPSKLLEKTRENSSHPQDESPSSPSQQPHSTQTQTKNCLRCSGSFADSSSLYCTKDCLEKYVTDNISKIKASKIRIKSVVLVDQITGKQVTGLAEERILQWIKDHPTYEISKNSLSSHSHTLASPSESDAVKEVYKESISSTPMLSEDDKSNKNDPVRSNVKKYLYDCLLSRCRDANEKNLDENKIEAIASNIEEELFKLFKDTGTKYKAKYRSLKFNIQDVKNEVLFQKVVKGLVAPSQLVRMSSEELASKELARWREREARHALEMIQKEENEQQNRPHTKKTHKGEIEIEEDSADFSVLESSDKPKKEESPPLTTFSDTTSKHKYHLFDLNCKICTGKIAPPVPEEPSAKKMRISHSISSDNQPTSSVHPEQSTIAPNPHSPQLSSPSMTPPPRPPGEDELPSSTVPSFHKSAHKGSPSVWKGFIYFQDVAKFVVNAHKVSGPTDHLTQDIPDTVTVVGRIAPEQVWDYLTKIKQNGTKELIVIRFYPANDEEKEAYVAFYKYLHQRKRYAVIGNSSHMIKDFYLLPLASYSPVPTVLLPFDGPGLDSNRPPLILGVIVRHTNRPRSSLPLPPDPPSFRPSKKEYDPYEPSYTPPPSDSFRSPESDSFSSFNEEKEYSQVSTRDIKESEKNESESSRLYDPAKIFPEDDYKEHSNLASVQNSSSKEGGLPFTEHFGDLDIDKILTDILSSPDPAAKTAAVISQLVGSDDLEKQTRLLERFTQEIENKKRLLSSEVEDEEVIDLCTPSSTSSSIPQVQDTATYRRSHLQETIVSPDSSVAMPDNKDPLSFKNPDPEEVELHQREFKTNCRSPMSQWEEDDDEDSSYYRSSDRRHYFDSRSRHYSSRETDDWRRRSSHHESPSHHYYEHRSRKHWRPDEKDYKKKFKKYEHRRY